MANIAVVENQNIAARVFTRLLIDKKLLYPEKSAKILPGRHEISIDISAFLNGDAKYAEPEILSLVIQPQHVYRIEVTTMSQTLTNEDIIAQYIVFDNDNVFFQKKVLLKTRYREYDTSMDAIMAGSMLSH